MPRVTIKTGIVAANGQEEVLTAAPLNRMTSRPLALQSKRIPF